MTTVPSFNSPSPLCRWAIHFKISLSYGRSSCPVLSLAERGINDGSTWAEWPAYAPARDIASTLYQGLQQNRFTAVQPG
ncbi:hypothetical protein F4804DRAFT_321871 [Jackrogersella minutella]|nr:hypothetical protein F4804DRAFT_321871 [Jackrogersella minutella]